MTRILRRRQSKCPVRLKDLLVTAEPDQISANLAVLRLALVRLHILGETRSGQPTGDRRPVIGLQPLTQPEHAAGLPVDRLWVDPVGRLFRSRPHADEGCVVSMRSQPADIRRQGVSGADFTKLPQGRLDAPAAVLCVGVHVLIELSFKLVVFHIGIFQLRVFQFPANSIGDRGPAGVAQSRAQMAQIGCRILDGPVAEITRRLVSEIFNKLLVLGRDPARPARLPCIINSHIRRKDVRLASVAR
ncbi:hypothetical protein ACVW0W_001326 [Bradyrhizobium sp. USDA 4469]